MCDINEFYLLLLFTSRPKVIIIIHIITFLIVKKQIKQLTSPTYDEKANENDC